MTTSEATIREDAERCPICGVLFKLGDACATDITEGTCHAECLADTPIVDLETGDETAGPTTTFPWEPWPTPPTSEKTDD